MRVALLLLAAAWLGGGCRAYQDREAIRSLVASLGPRLSGERSVLGAVETHGDEIELLDGGLTLVARVVHDNDQRGSSFHVHVMATPRGQATGGFDICLVGRDLAEVADELVKYALPPIVSAIRDEPVLESLDAAPSIDPANRP